MSELKTIWVVEWQGSDEEWHIVAVFTTEAKAKDALANTKTYSDNYRVASAPLDPQTLFDG